MFSTCCCPERSETYQSELSTASPNPGVSTMVSFTLTPRSSMSTACLVIVIVFAILSEDYMNVVSPHSSWEPCTHKVRLQLHCPIAHTRAHSWGSGPPQRPKIHVMYSDRGRMSLPIRVGWVGATFVTRNLSKILTHGIWDTSFFVKVSHEKAVDECRFPQSGFPCRKDRESNLQLAVRCRGGGLCVELTGQG